VRRERDIVFVFLAAALCDGLLGTAFFLFPTAILQLFGAPPPNHPGYMQFSALIMVTFSILFAQIAAGPKVYRDLIPYGILLKASFCIVVFGWWAFEGVPFVWKPLALADVGFLLLFAWAYRVLGEGQNC